MIRMMLVLLIRFRDLVVGTLGGVGGRGVGHYISPPLPYPPKGSL